MPPCTGEWNIVLYLLSIYTLLCWHSHYSQSSQLLSIGSLYYCSWIGPTYSRVHHHAYVSAPVTKELLIYFGREELDIPRIIISGDETECVSFPTQSYLDVIS